MSTMHRVSVARAYPCSRDAPDSDGWCAYCYANLKGRASYKGHAGYRPKAVKQRPYEDSPMKKPSKDELASAAQTGLTDAQFASKYPMLTSHLVDEKWDDGTARTPSTVSLSVKDGVWQLGINDKSLKQSLYTSGPSLNACLQLAEKAIADGTSAWRKWGKNK